VRAGLLEASGTTSAGGLGRAVDAYFDRVEQDVFALNAGRYLLEDER
jgi:hypothetical protein